MKVKTLSIIVLLATGLFFANAQDTIPLKNGENNAKEIINSVEEIAESSQAATHEDYALLHIYRRCAYGAMINFDLHIDENVICRVKNKWRETIKIDREGLVSLWAKTEAKIELPILIEFGKEYFIRCSVTMGVAVGRPKLELVDEHTGKEEFEASMGKKKKQK